MIKKLKAYYEKYKEYIRVDVIMYLVMVIIIAIAVAIISILRK